MSAKGYISAAQMNSCVLRRFDIRLEEVHDEDLPFEPLTRQVCYWYRKCFFVEGVGGWDMLGEGS